MDLLKKVPRIEKYGREWKFPGGISHLDVEFAAYRMRLSPEQGGLGAEEHFRRICKALDPGYVWMSDDPDIPYQAQYNDRMLEFSLKCNWLAVTGPASAGKSAFFARWVCINWLAYFNRCAAVVTSTTKQGARTRIWSHISEFFQRINGIFPVHINETSCIVSVSKDIGAQTSDRSAIMLVTPEKDKAGSGDSKLIGLHNDWVFMIGDEYGAMSPALAKAAENLQVNPNFWAGFLFNAGSIFDPHGVQSTPKSGSWGDVSDTDLVWDTERGLALHLDGEETPNKYSNPPDKYPYLQQWSHVQKEQAEGRGNTAGYWRYVKAFWPPQGSEDSLYNELELTQSGALERAIWQGETISLASLDPAYRSGGDNFQACFGKLGSMRDGKGLEFSEHFSLLEDVKNTDSVLKQIARQFVAKCRERKIGVRQTVVDCTAGGSLMADAVEDEFGERGVLRIEFGGSPSDRVVEVREDPVTKKKIDVTAKEKFGNRATELWLTGIPFIKSRQLKGISAAQADQMCSRQANEKSRKQWLESKADYKRRTHKPSPDAADSGFMLLCLAIERFNLASQDKLAAPQRTDMRKAFAKFQVEDSSGEYRMKW